VNISWQQLRTLLENATSEVLLWGLLFLQFCALLSVPSVLLRRRGRPTSALAWLLALMALPAVGSLSWWAIGRTRMERRVRKRTQKRRDFLRLHGAPSPRAATRFLTLLPTRAQNDYAFGSAGNHVKLLTDGKNAFPEMEMAIDNAKECINLIVYIFVLDEVGERFCQKLIGRAKNGIRVRLLVDGMGSQKYARKLRNLLTPHGIEFAVFLPSRLWPLYAPRFNFINHRKILVIDNRLAFTGGMNIAAEYEHSWRDLMVRIEGPAVEGLNHIFLEDWFFATGNDIADALRSAHEERPGGIDAAIVSSGPDTEGWIHDAYFMAINDAKRRLMIATPYFIPTQALLTALRTAAGRGVEVCIVVPSISDVRIVKWASRSFYPDLVDVGVRIFEYSGTMLHGKAMIVDETFVSVGTANIDNRSLRLNFEVNCFVDDKTIADELNAWIVELLSDSTEMTSEFLEQKPLGRKLLESAAHLMSPLL
jgi:cardiolipin synthase A/B